MNYKEMFAGKTAEELKEMRAALEAAEKANELPETEQDVWARLRKLSGSFSHLTGWGKVASTSDICDSVTFPSPVRPTQLQAIAKLMQHCDAANGETQWRPEPNGTYWTFQISAGGEIQPYWTKLYGLCSPHLFRYKSEGALQNAFFIYGEETIRIALGGARP